MIRYLDNQEKGRTKDLWREAFPEDSEDFLDYYDQEKMSINQVLVREEDGVIQSMLHQNPYRLQVRDTFWNVDYIVAVATRSDMRHRGYMRSLLIRMMTDMREQQMPFCFLMPAREAIYLPFGFTFIFRQSKWRLRSLGSGSDSFSEGFARKQVLCKGDLNIGEDYNRPGRRGYLGELAKWMNQWLSARYQVYAVRDEAYLRRLFLELASENGSFDVLMDRHGIAGMQAFWGIDEVEQRLLYGKEPYVEEEKDTEKPAIMARIITPEVFVKAIHLRSEEREDERAIRLYLEDPLIPENDGLWIWHLNHEMSWMERGENDKKWITEGSADCGKLDEKSIVEKCEETGLCKTSGIKDGAKVAGISGETICEYKHKTECECEWDLCMSIAEFTSWLFGYSVPAVVGEWDKVVEPLKGVFLDEVV